MWGKKRKKLAVAIVCSDWRLHHSRSEFNGQIARAAGVDGVDFVAVPGPDGLLLPERAAEWQIALAQAKLLIGAHAPVALALVAHQRCAGHPVSDDAHLGDVAKTAAAFKTETAFAGAVAAMVAEYRSDLHWNVRVVKRI
ncbi:MAG TPA: carbonic anhydrase [Rhizomicrobium sp.]|nr:carbonic anhydrase [Rhizomicrobium sp.]